jgi:hypothetical protein
VVNYKDLFGSLVQGNWPAIKAKNASGPGAQDGTPYTKEFIDDIWGFMQAVMSKAQLTPNGNAEASNASQILQALEKIFLENSESQEDLGIAIQKTLAQYGYSKSDAAVNARDNVGIEAGGLLTIDGVDLAAGDAVLLSGQTDRKENGLYTAEEGPWERLDGYGPEDGKAFTHEYIYIEKGEDAGKLFTIGTQEYVIGETDIEFFETAFSFKKLPGKKVIRDRNGNFEGSGSGGGDGGGGGETVPTPLMIVVESLPYTTVYEVEDEFDPEGLVIKAIYAGFEAVIYPGDGASGYLLSEPGMDTEGEKEVTASYMGVETMFGITVYAHEELPAPELAGIEITAPPEKLVYETNEPLDLSGMIVSAVYSYGPKQVLSYDSTGIAGWKSSNPDMATAGSKTVTITHKPDDAAFTQTFNITVELGGSWDGFVDNETECNRPLLSVLSVSTPQEVWEICHGLINADGLPNFRPLCLGDYFDLTAGLPSPMNIAWNSSHINLRLYILGFNCYKGSQGNTKNHILWGFKNSPIVRRMNATSTNAGGYSATELRTEIEGNFLASMIAALGADYFCPVSRLISTKGGSMVFTSKLWLPNETEIYGVKAHSDDPTPQITIPLYSKDAAHRKKNYEGSAHHWWHGSPYGRDAVRFCLVGSSGNIGSASAFSTYNVPPCFCQE